jgi:Zn-dependent metalloprotease
MKKLVVLVSSFLLLVGSVGVSAAPGRGNGASVVEAFNFGNLGQTGRGAAKADSAATFARGFAAARGAAGSEDFSARLTKRDDLGQTHVRLSQSIAGLPVVGAELIVHIDDATGVVRGVNGRFAADKGLARAAKVGAGAAVENAAAAFGVADYQVVGAPELTYIIPADGGEVRLAWTNVITYTDDEGVQSDRIFADALTGDAIERHPQIQRVKNRKTYTCNNGTSLPGTLLFNEGGTSADLTAMAAYNNAGTTYDYYWTRHGRDSYNNAGATLTSSVHYSTSYNNAFWNGSQMVYGDGDGSTFSPLSKALDVVAHELTHAVTGSTAGLVYSNESGGLNEAMSDCLGSAAEAYSDGAISLDTWKIGEDIYTPGIAGDALRRMDDPAIEGDRDYYPTRYIGTADNGGVHTNSGIQNLAFKLLVTGGTHPRGKTTTSVTGVGMAAAEKIFYRALDVYTTSSTNFRKMRDNTVQAATDLYGAGTTNVTQTGNAWSAVGNAWTRTTAAIATTGASSYSAQFTTTTTGYVTGQLLGPGTDYDLYLEKWNGSAWAQVASGATSSTNETVQYNGTAGSYRWRTHAFAGTGTYNLYSSAPR